MHTRLRFGLVLAGAAMVCACDSTSMFHGNSDDSVAKDEDYVQSASPITGVELDALWDRAEFVLGVDGYGRDGSRSRFADRELVSHWNTMLAPTRYEGKRKRARVRFRWANAGGWIVGVTVQVQRNTDINQPSNASQANWEDVASNTDHANVLLWKIESGFREPGSVEMRK